MIPKEFQPNLNTEDMLKFVANTNWGPGSIYESPPPEQNGYTLSAIPKRTTGTFDFVDDGAGGKAPVVMFWTRLEHYMITEGLNPKRVISDLQIAIPQEQKLSITIWAHLFIKSGVDAPSDDLKSKIEAAFKDYDFQKDGAVLDYAERKLASEPGIKRNMLAVSYSYSAKKILQPKSYDEVRDATLALYENRANGRVYPNPQNPRDPGEPIGDDREGWLAKKHFDARLLRYEDLLGFPEKRKDPLHEREIQPGSDPESTLGDIAESEANSLDCGGVFTQHNYKIITLLEYPEFKMIWRDRKIVLYRDDCGNEISIRIQIPVIQKRTSELNLWAYMRYPDNAQEVNDLIAKVLEKCAIRAALSGAVVGVALGNFSAAVAAFKAVFQRCIEEHIDAVIRCMIPGLSILTEVEDPPGWEDFIVP